MTNLFKKGETALNAMFECFAEPICYRRNGNVLAVAIPAKIGKTLFRTDDIATGVSMRFEERDFIVQCTEFPANFTPAKGDEIVYDSRLYMVSAPDGEPCWRWHTRHSHITLRIHTKYIGKINE